MYLANHEGFSEAGPSRSVISELCKEGCSRLLRRRQHPQAHNNRNEGKDMDQGKDALREWQTLCSKYVESCDAKNRRNGEQGALPS